MGRNDLGGVLEDFSVHPLSDEQERQAALTLAEAALRWGADRRRRHNRSRVAFNLEQALDVLGLLPCPTYRYLMGTTMRSLSSLGNQYTEQDGEG